MSQRAKLMALSLADLMALHNDLIDVIKAKRHAESQAKRWTFSVGDKVQFKGNRAGHVNGVIKDIRITKASVKDEATGMLWNVPLHMLSARPNPDKPASTPTF